MPLFGPPNVKKLKEKRDVDGLIKALSYPKDPYVRVEAARALGEHREARAIQALIAALRDRDDDVGMAAAGALGQIGNAQVVEPLVAALKDLSASVRGAAVKALGHLGGARALESLVTLLQDRSVCFEAARALGQIGEPGISALIAALRDKSQPIRLAAAAGLDSAGWKPGRDSVGAAYWIARRKWEECARIGVPGIEQLVLALQYDREWAAEALGKLKDTRSVEPIIAALKTADKDVCGSAIEALGTIGDARAVEPLIAVLKVADKDVCGSAIGALGAIGDVRAVEPLIALLTDHDQTVGVAAAKALGKFGVQAMEPLIAALHDRRSQVRLAAAKALEAIGWKPGDDVIGAAYWIAKQKWEECARIGAPALEPLIARLVDKSLKIREAAAATLGAIGDPRGSDVLIAALQDNNESMRQTVMEALGQIGDVRAVEALIALLKDEDATVSKAAAEALLMIREPDVAVPLVAALGELDANVRRPVADALDKIGWRPGVDEAGALYWFTKGDYDNCARVGAPAVEPLIKLLEQGRHSDEVRAAAKALVGLYRSGQLDSRHKRQILQQRDAIQSHSDSHTDTRPSPDDDIDFERKSPQGWAGSVNYHTDQGIGINFPL